MYQHPLIPLVFSIILTLLIIKQCLTRKKFLKVRLFLAFFLNFVLALLLVFEPEIHDIPNTDDIFNYTLLGFDILIGLLFIIFSELEVSSEQFTQNLISTIKSTKLYVVVDRKCRVKEISDLFLQELDMSFEEVYKGNIFKIINSKNKIVKFNNVEVDEDELTLHFKDFKNLESEVVLDLNDQRGDNISYCFHQNPLQVFGKFKGRLFIGNKVNSENLLGMEKNLAQSNEDLSLMRDTFTSILAKTADTIFFHNLDNKEFWGNEALSKMLNFTKSSMDFDDYTKNIHPDDLPIYLKKLDQVSNLNPDYGVSYRYNLGSRYAYVKEEGSRISNSNVVEICGFIRLIDGYRFARTNTELDQVLSEPELYAHLTGLYKNNRTFEVIYLKVVSIPQINEKYGRGIGNVALNEYIKMIKKTFVDSNMLYRLGGLDFVAVIIDYRKMTLLKNCLADNEKILHVNGQYGSVKLIINAVCGIASSDDGKDGKDVIQKASEAAKMAQSPQYKADYAYYRSLR